MKTLKTYSVVVFDSNNDGVYEIQAYNKRDAIKKVASKYNTKTQSGTTYYVKEI
jgi:hypothetical protein